MPDRKNASVNATNHRKTANQILFFFQCVRVCWTCFELENSFIRKKTAYMRSGKKERRVFGASCGSLDVSGRGSS